MPISAQVSLWGLMQLDPTILDGLMLPAGMDADNLKDNLLLETESMEILYPNAPFLKAAIAVWSKERFDVWNKLYATTVLDYNPIENYDRMEESKSDSSGSSSGRTTTTASKNVTGGNNQNVSTGSYKSRVHGNIGVTTTQQMIEQERRSVEFCMTEYIINDFISRFCVGVY